jgi:hypothetical protein
MHLCQASSRTNIVWLNTIAIVVNWPTELQPPPVHISN